MSTPIASGWEEWLYSHTQKYLTQGIHSKIGVKCAPAELIYKSLVCHKEKNQENDGKKTPKLMKS